MRAQNLLIVELRVAAAGLFQNLCLAAIAVTKLILSSQHVVNVDLVLGFLLPAGSDERDDAKGNAGGPKHGLCRGGACRKNQIVLEQIDDVRTRARQGCDLRETSRSRGRIRNAASLLRDRLTLKKSLFLTMGPPSVTP